MDIRRFFTTLLDILFPPKKASLGFHTEDVASCFEPYEVMDSICALLTYRNPIVQKSIWQLKYYRNEKVIASLASLLYSFLLEEISDLICFSGFVRPLIIPMPISVGRRAERGYNQCEILLEHFQSLDQKAIEIQTNIIVKVRDTPRQTKLGRKDRLKNIRGCFAIPSPEFVQGRNIVLIDDVVTTGSTISEVKRVLFKAGAREITAITLAH